MERGADQRTGSTGPTPGRERAGAATPVRRLINLIVVAIVVAFVSGFAVFVARLEDRDVLPLPQGQAAVALTGGAERISDALELLAAGKVGRLLITGVNQTTTGGEIARLTPRFSEWLRCCVDLGYEALNTRGNAVETRDWARRRGLKGPIVVVTSTYHMPRALLELRRLMPDIAFTPYPVVTERQRAGDWWLSARAGRLLVVEYVKYLAALARAVDLPPPR